MHHLILCLQIVFIQCHTGQNGELISYSIRQAVEGQITLAMLSMPPNIIAFSCITSRDVREQVAGLYYRLVMRGGRIPILTLTIACSVEQERATPRSACSVQSQATQLCQYLGEDPSVISVLPVSMTLSLHLRLSNRHSAKPSCYRTTRSDRATHAGAAMIVVSTSHREEWQNELNTLTLILSCHLRLKVVCHNIRSHVKERGLSESAYTCPLVTRSAIPCNHEVRSKYD